MSLDKLKADLKAAMLSRDEFTVSILRMLISVLNNSAIEKRAKSGTDELSGEEILAIFRKEAKKRREAAAMFETGNRPELKERELKEAEFVERYLPKQLAEKEIEAVVLKVLASGLTDFGAVMREAMKELKGRADGNAVQAIIKKHLG